MIQPQPLRVLFFDIETAPLLAHIWRPTDDFIPHDRLLHDSFMLCWSAKWRGEPGVKSMKLTGEEATSQDDERIILGLAKLIAQADIVVAHNIENFDLPMLNNRLLVHGIEPMPPVTKIDTLKVSKATFRLASNKLDYLAELLLGERKIKTDFDLWRRCYLGERAALREMEVYNQKDVDLLERVFERLIPYGKIPRLVENEAGMYCPYCGCVELERRGVRRTMVATYQRFRCKNPACGKYATSRIAEKVKGDLKGI